MPLTAATRPGTRPSRPRCSRIGLDVAQHDDVVLDVAAVPREAAVPRSAKTSASESSSCGTRRGSTSTLTSMNVKASLGGGPRTRNSATSGSTWNVPGGASTECTVVVIDLHRRGVEEYGIVDLRRIAVEGRAGDKIEAAARGVDLVLQSHQHAAVAGMDVLQGHHVEPREDSHQAFADLGVCQAVVVQAVEIESRHADRRAHARPPAAGRPRLRWARCPRPCAARSARIETFPPRCDGLPASSSPTHTSRQCPERRRLRPGYYAT